MLLPSQDTIVLSCEACGNALPKAHLEPLSLEGFVCEDCMWQCSRCADCGKLTLEAAPQCHCECEGFCDQCAEDHDWQECIKSRMYAQGMEAEARWRLT